MRFTLGDIAAAPDDHDLKLVAADVFDEAGQPGVAAALRWMGRKRLAPYKLPPSLWDTKPWVWYDPSNRSTAFYNVCCHLRDHAPESCRVPSGFIDGDYWTCHGSAGGAVLWLVKRFVTIWESIQ